VSRPGNSADGVSPGGSQGGQEVGTVEPVTLRTERALLRPWRDDDLDPFAALCANAAVMRHFPSVMTRADSDAFAGRIRGFFAEHGWGLWVLELPGQAPFAGFVGLARHHFPAHFTPAVEVGWRLDPRWWGRGLAPEAARAALAFGFDTVGLAEIVSMTVPANRPSRRVMEKLGMRHDPRDDFDHPRIPAGDPLRRHVLYRLSRTAWSHQPDTVVSGSEG
jgi:RimJ/RimL family protein N-acetyltransferase